MNPFEAPQPMRLTSNDDIYKRWFRVADEGGLPVWACPSHMLAAELWPVQTAMAKSWGRMQSSSSRGVVCLRQSWPRCVCWVRAR